MSKTLVQVGEYRPGAADTEAEISRDYYRQGWIFKDEDAFLHHPDQVCYVPELSDSAYTRNDFLDLCNGQEDLAAQCFYAMDWQHPETWVDEQFREDEWAFCEHCQKIYEMDGERKSCPSCGSTPK